jgi:hypothetical protein
MTLSEFINYFVALLVIPNKFQKAGSGEPIGLNLSLTRRLKH